MIPASIMAQVPDYSGLGFTLALLFGAVPVTIIINVFVGMAMGYVTKAGDGTSLFVGTFAGLVGSIGTIAMSLWLADNDHFEVTNISIALTFCSTFFITALLSFLMMIATKRLGDAWASRKTSNS